MTTTGDRTTEGLRSEYATWLAGVVPADYDADPGRYRFDMELRRAHQGAAFDAGWLMPRWPRELGGRELDALETVAVRLEGARRAAPKLPSVQSVGVIAPALREFGTPEQCEELLVPTLRGELTWALGMSEPESGSDLASIRTRARLRDDRYVISGQKVWTTQAHTSEWGMIYCRTDPDAARHRGISCLLLDMRSPGITVRPIEMGWEGADEFCEVFLDEVEVPVANVLGAVDDGWRVAMSALNHERDMIWIMNSAEIERGLRRIARDVRAHDRADVLLELGRLATDRAALQATGMRSLSNALAGLRSPEFNILKLLGSESLQRTWDLAFDVAGPEALLDTELQLEDLDALGATLYGGTSEIQRNIIGERVLRLPRD